MAFGHFDLIKRQSKTKEGFTPLNPNGSSLKAGNLTGFTLIELLVVVAIISIVVVLISVAFNRYRMKARDDKRVSDVKQMATALELYFSANDSYPAAITPGQPLVGPNGHTYLAKVPSNPTPWLEGGCLASSDYAYVNLGSGGYLLCACLGTSVDSVSSGVMMYKNGSFINTNAQGTCYPALFWTARVISSPAGWSGVAITPDGVKMVTSNSPNPGSSPGGGYIFTSADSGATWTEQTGSGIKNWEKIVYSADGTTIMATAFGYFYVSTNDGVSWTQKNSSRFIDASWGTGKNFACLSTSCSKLIASYGNDQPYVSTDYGATWVEQTGAPTKSWNKFAASSDGTKVVAIIVGSKNIATSSDSGATWIVNTAPSPSSDWRSVASSADGTKLAVASGYDHIYTSINSGTTWVAKKAADWDASTGIKISDDGTKIISNTVYPKVYISTNSGTSWTSYTPGSFGSFVDYNEPAISSDGTKMAVAYHDGFIYTSADSGVTWTQHGASASLGWTLASISGDGAKQIATSNFNIYASSDSGATWTLATGNGTDNFNSIATSADGTKLVATNYSGYIYTSTNSGVTWVKNSYTTGSNLQYSASSADGNKLVVAKYSSTSGYISVDGGANWTVFTLPASSTSYSGGNIRITADGSKMFWLPYDTNNRYIYTSVDNGANWSTVDIGNGYWWGNLYISADGSTIAAISGGTRNWCYIRLSTDSGATWSNSTAGRKTWSLVAISADGARIAAVDSNNTTSDNRFYISTNYGATWTARTAMNGKIWKDLRASSEGTTFIALEENGKIYTSP